MTRLSSFFFNSAAAVGLSVAMGQASANPVPAPDFDIPTAPSALLTTVSDLVPRVKADCKILSTLPLPKIDAALFTVIERSPEYSREAIKTHVALKVAALHCSLK